MASFGVLLAVSLAFGPVPASVRNAIEMKERDYENAMMKKDASWFDRVTTPDFTETDHGKTMNRATALSTIHRDFSMLKSIKSVKSEIQTIKMEGSGVVVVSTAKMVAEVVDSKGKKHLISDQSVQEEHWIPAGKDFKIKSIKTLVDKATMDGKPFNGGM